MNTCSRTESVLVVVDLQDSFLAPISNRAEVLHRCKFLIEAANALQIPIVATEQYATRMGETNCEIIQVLGEAVPRIDKLCFSCAGSGAFQSEIRKIGKSQAVVIGIETHICVCQTTLDLLDGGFKTFVAADAVSGRLPDAHAVALNRLANAGAIVTHTESVVYEWLKSAEASEFKTVLQLVKKYAG